MFWIVSAATFLMSFVCLNPLTLALWLFSLSFAILMMRLLYLNLSILLMWLFWLNFSILICEMFSLNSLHWGANLAEWNSADDTDAQICLGMRKHLVLLSWLLLPLLLLLLWFSSCSWYGFCFYLCPLLVFRVAACFSFSCSWCWFWFWSWCWCLISSCSWSGS